MNLSHVIASLVLALAGAGFAGYQARDDHGQRVELTRSTVSGPQDEALPDGVRVAEDGADLAALVNDPKGPEVIGLGSRVYETDLVIGRPLQLVGIAGAVIEGTGKGNVVVIEADDVVVKNVTVRRSGARHTLGDAGVRAIGRRVRVEHIAVEDCLFGISFHECVDCLIEGVHIVGWDRDPAFRGDAIKLWESDRTIVRSSFIERSRDIVVWYSQHVTLEDNVVTQSRYGTHFMYANDSRVLRSRLVDNVVGVFVMYSSRVTVEDNVLAGAAGPAGIGIGFKEADDVTLTGNALVGNTVGAYLDQSPRTPGKKVRLEGNLIALNQVGLRLHASQTGAAFLRNDFHENATVVEIEAGDALGSTFSENHFSDYEGYDLDRDGFGDVAYEQRILSSEIMSAHQDLRLLQGTAAMGAIDAIAHAFPMLAARRVLSDARPRTGRTTVYTAR